MKRILYVLLMIPLLILSFNPTIIKAKNGTNLNDEIIYSIFVDRFNNGSQAPSDQIDIDDPLTYTGGDIQGVTMKLDTIQDHGFTAISLSPIMENAPRGYHGYWVEDFFEIEEEFGTMDDLKKLLEEAHGRNIKVILELPINYVAKTSPLVADSDKQDWFSNNAIDPIEATKWLDDVYVLDQTNSNVQDYLTDVALYWINEVEIDGFILHAADQADQSFLEKLTQTIKEKNPNFYLIATTLQGNEDVAGLQSIQNFDAIANENVYGVMNDVFIESDIPVSSLYDSREGDQFRDLLYLDNINTARFSNNFADNGRNAITTWSLALSYLYLTPGVPIVYQGSEVPMYGPGFPENQYIIDFSSADPDLEKVFDRMAAVRAQFPALVYGDMEQVAVDEGFSLFKRTLDDKSIFVAINNDSQSRVVEIPSIDADLQLRGLLHDDTIRENENGNYLIGMERESAEVFIVESDTGFNWGFIAFVAGVFVVFIGAIFMLTRKQKQRELAEK